MQFRSVLEDVEADITAALHHTHLRWLSIHQISINCFLFNLLSNLQFKYDIHYGCLYY